MKNIKTLHSAAKELGFADICKFKSQFRDLIVVVSGQEMIDQQVVEKRIADFADPFSDKFQGRKRSSRKPSKDNIGLMQSRINRRKRKIKELQKTQDELNEIYDKSKTDFDQLQFLSAQVKVSEAEAGLKKMEDEVSGLIKARIEELKVAGDESK